MGSHYLTTMPPRGSACKNWCVTLNNPTPEDVQSFQDAITAHCAFGVYQHEVGESGTPHLQGYLHFGNKVRLEWIRARFSARAHYEVARGTPVQNVAYCTKEDTRQPGTEPFTYGEQPAGAGARTDLEDVAAEIVVKRRRLTDVAADFPVDFIKYHSGLTALSARLAQPRRWKTVVYWLYGSTGCGKSRAADRLAPGAYWKMGGNKWWDGYEGHEDVIIDDYRRDLCPFHELLRLFDRYPMRVEYKGGVVDFAARRVFVTAPQAPDVLWEGRSEEDLGQLMRRIEHVVNADVENMLTYLEPVVLPDIIGLGPLEPNENDFDDALELFA